MQIRDRGVISTFFADRGYGFIQRPGLPDLFLHCKAFRDAIPPEDIQPGLAIEFIVESTQRGLRAGDAVIVPDQPLGETEVAR